MSYVPIYSESSSDSGSNGVEVSDPPFPEDSQLEIAEVSAQKSHSNESMKKKKKKKSLPALEEDFPQPAYQQAGAAPRSRCLMMLQYDLTDRHLAFLVHGSYEYPFLMHNNPHRGAVVFLQRPKTWALWWTLDYPVATMRMNEAAPRVFLNPEDPKLKAVLLPHGSVLAHGKKRCLILDLQRLDDHETWHAKDQFQIADEINTLPALVFFRAVEGHKLSVAEKTDRLARARHIFVDALGESPVLRTKVREFFASLPVHPGIAGRMTTSEFWLSELVRVTCHDRSEFDWLAAEPVLGDAEKHVFVPKVPWQAHLLDKWPYPMRVYSKLSEIVADIHAFLDLDSTRKHRAKLQHVLIPDDLFVDLPSLGSNATVETAQCLWEWSCNVAWKRLISWPWLVTQSAACVGTDVLTASLRKYFYLCTSAEPIVLLHEVTKDLDVESENSRWQKQIILFAFVAACATLQYREKYDKTGPADLRPKSLPAFAEGFCQILYAAFEKDPELSLSPALAPRSRPLTEKLCNLAHHINTGNWYAVLNLWYGNLWTLAQTLAHFELRRELVLPQKQELETMLFGDRDFVCLQDEASLKVSWTVGSAPHLFGVPAEKVLQKVSKKKSSFHRHSLEYAAQLQDPDAEQTLLPHWASFDEAFEFLKEDAGPRPVLFKSNSRSLSLQNYEPSRPPNANKEVEHAEEEDEEEEDPDLGPRKIQKKRKSMEKELEIPVSIQPWSEWKDTFARLLFEEPEGGISETKLLDCLTDYFMLAEPNEAKTVTLGKDRWSDKELFDLYYWVAISDPFANGDHSETWKRIAKQVKRSVRACQAAAEDMKIGSNVILNLRSYRTRKVFKTQE